MTIESSASELIESNLTKFAVGVIRSFIPNEIDGLKSVHRRIIVTLRNKINSKVPSAKLLGEVMELHPHGDSSTYGAAVRLGQSWNYNPPILDFRSESSGGTYTNSRPGDHRYTALRVPQYLHDLFFSDVEYRSLPKQIDEMESGFEPIYLVPSLPTTLLYSTDSIGYGYPSRTAARNISDICDLVVAYAKHRSTKPQITFDYTKYVEKIIPDFASRGVLTNYDELVDAYKKGDFNFPIKLEGIVQITSDSIRIKTLPANVPFMALEEKLQSFVSSKDYKGGYFDKNILSIKGVSNEYDIGDIVVRVKRGVNVFELWEKLAKKITFSSNYKPIPNYESDFSVVQLSPINLLESWYLVRYNILVTSKKIQIGKLVEDLRKVQALVIISTDIDGAINIIKKNTKQDGIIKLMEKFDLTELQANYLVNSPLHTITSSTIDENKAKESRLSLQIKSLMDSFSKIPEEIANKALDMKKKYGCARRTIIRDFLGYVRVDSGCIQYESLDEIPDIINDFPNNNIEIYSYDGPHLYRVNDSNKLIPGYISKYTTGDIYGLKNNYVYTVNIKDGKACCVKGFISGSRADGYFYSTPKSRVIYRSGEIRVVNLEEEFTVRKSISSGSMTNAIYVYPDVKQDHYVVGLSTGMQNTITIQKIIGDKLKITLSPMGNVKVLHSTNKHMFINIPPEFLNRLKVKVVELVDIEKLLDGKLSTRLDLNTFKNKPNKYVKFI